jgi:hypothetical protein
MKKRYVLKISCLIFFIAVLNIKAQVSARYTGLQQTYNTSDLVIEGIKTKQLPVVNDNGNIYTPFEIQTTKDIKNGTVNEKIIVELSVGQIIDKGTIIENKNSHLPNNLPTGKILLFLTKRVNGHYGLLSFTDVSNPNSIIANFTDTYKLYTNLTDLYTDLSTISGKSIPVGKIKVDTDVKNETIDIPANNLSPVERTKNFQEIIAAKIKLATSNPMLNKTTLVNDLTLQVANPVIIGSFFEFDVNIKADNNTTYLDNVPVWLTYNNAVFGSSVVAASNVTVTNGTNFSNPTNYLPGNGSMMDNSANVFAFAISANFVGTPVRTQITTSYQFLARVRLGVVNCGNVNTSLTNSATAINACFYTSTPSGTTFSSYNTLTYNGSLTNNITFCPPVIKDFNSPINGGFNQILTIKGTKFGATRGNGQVKFRNSDLTGFPYLNKCDNIDYTFWNDTMIQIRMPSLIDTIVTGVANTPGSGNFKVVTNANDSAVSTVNLLSQPFQVYYSVANIRPAYTQSVVTTAQKNKYNLYNSVPASGGYVMRVDTSISNHGDRMGCVIKAVKAWRCLTAVNIKIQHDTILVNQNSPDFICHVYFAPSGSFASPAVVANTGVWTQLCPTGPTRVIRDFDISVNKSKTFFCDTTGASLPANTIDFYEVMLHEIGHGIGLEHVIDSSQVMYYRTLGNQPSTIPGGARRVLVPFTSDVDGGDNQVSTSQTNITNQCAFADMILLNSGSCAIIGIEELLGNNFNAIIYPNPSQDGKINISFDAFESSKPLIEVYDVVGKKLYSETLTNNYNKHFVHTVNLNDLSSGIYILNIRINSKTASFKVIKN